MRRDVRDHELTPAALRLVELARDSLAQHHQPRASFPQRKPRTIAPLVRKAGLVAGLAAAGALLAFGVRELRLKQAALTVRVDGSQLEPGGMVRADGRNPQLHFSDGSEVALEAEGALRLRSLDEHGAHLTLDGGRAHVYVVHAPQTHWLIDAGPFEVDVVGTSFEISWSTAARELDVRLENGALRVSGPMSDTPLSLRAGQWLTVRGGEDVLIRELASVKNTLEAAPIGSTEPAGAPPAPPADAGDPITPAPAAIEPNEPNHAAPAPAALRARWHAELAQGKFQAIVSEATSMGLDNALAQSSVSELAALGDAARYSRRSDVARAALLALRRRFASSEHAHTAAFLLGRLAEAEQDVPGALAWFQTYLSERPAGAYASEALGRRMTIAQRLQGNDAARPLAAEYLRRFPHGTYAGAARSLSP